MTSPNPYTEVPAPNVPQPGYGLYSAAQVIPTDQWQQTWSYGVQYLAYTCTDGFTWPTTCGYSWGSTEPPITRTITITWSGTRTGTDPNFTYTITGTATVDSGDQRTVTVGDTTIPTDGTTTSTVWDAQTTPATGLSVTITDTLTGTSTTATLAQDDTTGAVTPATSTLEVEEAVLPPDKPGHGPTTVSGSSFAAGDRIECATVGYSFDEQRVAAEQSLLRSEERSVERAFWTGEADSAPYLASTEAIIVGPPAGSPPKEAIGELEAILGASYGGVGLLHAPRWTQEYFSDRRLTFDRSGLLYTPVGNRWVFGGGYVANTGPDGTPAGEGMAWVYATGWVVVRRSPVQFSEAFDPVTNLNTVLAERLVVITSECSIYAALVDMTGEG